MFVFFFDRCPDDMLLQCLSFEIYETLSIELENRPGNTTNRQRIVKESNRIMQAM